MGYSNDDFELIPHFISHTTSSGVKVTTKALKIRANYDARKQVFNNLLECLAKGPADDTLVMTLNTANFKRIPFTNNTFSSDQTTALIQEQNEFLHNVKAILVVNLGCLEGSFKENEKRDQEGEVRNRTR